MFASASCPSRRRHWTSTLSCGIRTPSNFASIARFSRRQDDPQHQAGMCRSRVLGQLRVSYQDCLIFCCLKSRQTISAFVGARFHSQGRPRAVQPRCAMSSFQPGLAWGCCWGRSLLPCVICGLSRGCLGSYPSGSPTSGPPPPLGHVKDWPRRDPTTPNSHSRPQSLFLVKRCFILVQYPKVSLRQFAQYFAVGLCAMTQAIPMQAITMQAITTWAITT